MAVIFAILLFSLLVFVHELGHFVAAKLSGVLVNEFSVFMGPAIVKWTRGETRYAIRCIPFGGYCAMEGEDEESTNPRAFTAAAWWKRLIILVAGSAMNFICGVLLIAIVLGSSEQYVSTQLQSVEDWSYAAGEQGLQAGDTIMAIGDEKVRIYGDFILCTTLMEEGNYDITVLRDGQELLLADVPMVRQEVQNEDGSVSRLFGVTFKVEQHTASSVASQIMPTAAYNVNLVVKSLEMLFTGKAGLKDMTGPVGIVDLMADTAASAGSFMNGLMILLDLGAMIAINLAIMNMLPIPALDGGRVFCLLITTAVEAITKKKIDPKYEAYLHAAGLVLLLLLMVVIMFKDVFTLFKG